MIEDSSETSLEISQWASEVIDGTSSYGSNTSISYSINNILGRPSKYPSYGDFSQVFQMRRYGPSEEGSEFSRKDQPTPTFHDFIILKYENFVLPRRVEVYETYNPGSIVRIFAYCESSKIWMLLWSAVLLEPVAKKARKFCPPIRNIDAPTRILRIELNHSLIDYYTGIDSILLSGIKCVPPSLLLKNTVIKGTIQTRLESVHFKPQKAQSENMKEFLKKDLLKFMKDIDFASSSKESECGHLKHKVDEREKTTLSDLPYEVLFNIMMFLDLRSLYCCSSVCKSFQQIASDSLLYIEVNLKFYWNFVNPAFIESLTRRSSQIKSLDFSSCGFFDSITSKDFVNFIRVNGKTLRHLRLNTTSFLNTLCLETISINCSNLTELMMRNYINVTTDRNFVSLQLLTELKVLDLEKTEIDSDTLLKILKNNPKLQRLNVAFSSQNVSMDEVCLQISVYNNLITSLDIWKSHHLSPSIGLRALSKCLFLESLNLGWCLREAADVYESLKQVVQNCTKLKKLVLAAARTVNERDLDNIAHFCGNLEQLDLLGICGVTKEMCERIILECPKLTVLDVSFCEQIDDLTVMCWRSEYGHRVWIKRSEVPND